MIKSDSPESTTMSKFERLKPPYVGVTTDSVIHLFLLFSTNIGSALPQNFSVQDNMGAALLKDVKTATDIVKTLKQNVDPNLSVTAKIRLIIDESDPTNLTLTSKRTIDFAKALEHAGADALTIHARTVNDTEQVSERSERALMKTREIYASHNLN